MPMHTRGPWHRELLQECYGVPLLYTTERSDERFLLAAQAAG